MDKNLVIAQEVLKNVGGKDNITSVSNCMTRLRFKLKDESAVNEAAIKNIEGVVGVAKSGGMYQVVVGQNVLKVCEHLNDMLGIKIETVDEDPLDNRGFSWKKVGKQIIGYISPTMFGIIPMLIVAGMSKTIGSILGPTLLNVISAESDLFIVFDLLYDVTFYFLPIFLGYSACKVLKMDPLYGIYLGALLIVPDFLAMIGAREVFTVYGIPAALTNYSQTFLPIMLAVPVCKLIWDFMKKISPDAIAAITVPLVTILVMTPLMFCVFGPVGSLIGQYIGAALNWMSASAAVIRCIGCVLVAVLLPFLIMGGMHTLLMSFAVAGFLAAGSEGFVFPPAKAETWAIIGVALAVFIKLRDKKEKGNALSCFVTGFFGGITEPAIYSIILRYKKAILALVIASAIGGLYCGIFQPEIYAFTGLCNIFSIAAPWPAGGTANLIHGVVMQVLSLAAGLVSGLLIINPEKKIAE